MIDGLRQIYPIVLLENGHYSIRGAELPMDPYSSNRSLILQLYRLILKLYSIDAFHLYSWEIFFVVDSCKESRVLPGAYLLLQI